MTKSLTPQQRAYREYLRTPHWQRLRLRILLRANNHCEWCGRFCGPNPHPGTTYCGSPEECEYCRFYFDERAFERELEHQSLEVHHKTYERLGHERDEDVAAICWTCHDGITDRAIDAKRLYRAGIIPKELSSHDAVRTRWRDILREVVRRWKK